MENSLSSVHNPHYQLHPSQRNGLSHFHAVTDGVWMETRYFLRRVLNERACGNCAPAVPVDHELFATLLDFVDQMQWAYRYPRRDSQLSVQS